MAEAPTGMAQAMAAVREGRSVKLLSGYLDRDATTPRLYADLDLAHYVELPEIVAVQPGQDPMDPWHVWVDARLALELRLPSGDPPGAGLSDDVEALFGARSSSLGQVSGFIPLGYRCSNPKTTSHTIGWCASD